MNEGFRVSFSFIKALEKSNLFTIIKKIPKADNVYEYAMHKFEEGSVSGTIYLENEVVDSFGTTVGFFGLNFEHKIFVYNIKKEGRIQ
jgi:hypothetical protein